MRIDVDLPRPVLERQLDANYRRIRGLERLSEDIACAPRSPGIAFRHRVVHGEHYVYAEDAARGCLAGYTVFNRLPGVSRRLDPVVRSPHSRYGVAYQRRGIATSVYEWWLRSGNNLMAGARQSPAAHALWRSLGNRFELMYVELRDGYLRYLGKQVDGPKFSDLETRMVILGQGWDMGRFAERAAAPCA